MELSAITDALVGELKLLRFGPPVAYVYNPLLYARAPYDAYIARYGRPPKEVVFLGMNPGPFGMAQTGVPFGEVGLVREWLKIGGPVGRPATEHCKRPVEGFACRRSEVSGLRLWGWARRRFGPPERFFGRFFVANYCPLLFLEEGGRNRTPDKLAPSDREPLFAACDRALRRTAEHLRPRHVVGVGRFAAERVRIALAGLDLAVGAIPHPSPASPAANRGWEKLAEDALRVLGIEV